MRGTFALVALVLGLAGAAWVADAREPRAPASPAAAEPAPASGGVPLKQEGGALLVPVMINDAVRLDFMLDSGASVVSIPADVAMTLMRTGTITREDFLGNETFQLADGSTVPSTILRIRSLKVGDLELRDVEASVSDVKGPLLLGETFLARLSTWSVDNQRHVLVLGPEIPGSPTATALVIPRRTRSHHPAASDDQASNDTPAPAAPPTAGITNSAQATTGAEWDTAFYQACFAAATPDTRAQQATTCHCIGAALQPLPLSRKHRLRPHSHEVLDAVAQCMAH
jgi:predicted aspartyl protease